jgi:hypothetical protein
MAPDRDVTEVRPTTDRRRAPRVLAAGLWSVQLAARARSELARLEVRDVSYLGLGLVAPAPLQVAVDEKVYLLLEFRGDGGWQPVRGALVRAVLRRRRPDHDGWFAGVQIDDLRATPWSDLVGWVTERASRS